MKLFCTLVDTWNSYNLPSKPLCSVACASHTSSTNALALTRAPSVFSCLRENNGAFKFHFRRFRAFKLEEMERRKCFSCTRSVRCSFLVLCDHISFFLYRSIARSDISTARLADDRVRREWRDAVSVPFPPPFPFPPRKRGNGKPFPFPFPFHSHPISRLNFLQLERSETAEMELERTIRDGGSRARRKGAVL